MLQQNKREDARLFLIKKESSHFFCAFAQQPNTNILLHFRISNYFIEEIFLPNSFLAECNSKFTFEFPKRTGSNTTHFLFHLV